MNPNILHLGKKLLTHEIYSQIRSIEELRLFMESHCYAVWDFMSLLKSLQLHLTSVTIPWTPPKDPTAARLVNEIVLCEESDLNIDGKAVSHMEMYLEAMEDIGARTEPFRTFLDGVHKDNLEQKMKQSQAPVYVRQFVMQTMHLSLHGTVEEIASNFLYGREDYIPEMFSNLLTQIQVPEKDAGRMYYYLRRHIEVDGDEHGPAALKLLDNLIGKDPNARIRAEKAAENAITARMALWDGLLGEILKLRGAKG